MNINIAFAKFCPAWKASFQENNKLSKSKNDQTKSKTKKTANIDKKMKRKMKRKIKHLNTLNDGNDEIIKSVPSQLKRIRSSEIRHQRKMY